MPCNSNDAKQRFNINKITSLEQYNSKIQNPTNNSFKLSNPDSTILGFHVVNPETDENQCLTINANGLSVLPCNMNGSQRFKTYYHSVIP